MTTRPTGGRPTQGRGSGKTVPGTPPALPSVRAGNGKKTAPSLAPIAKKLASGVAAADWGRIFGHTRRVARYTGYTLIPLALLVMTAVGILVVRLRHGPIAFDILVPPIERGINAELINNAVKIEGAEIRVGDSGSLEFRLRDITVLEANGETVAVAPLAAVTLSTAALWSARLVPARVELIDPQISLSYTDDAGLILNSPTQRKADETASPNAKVALQTPDASGGVPKPVPHQLNLAKMLSDASQRARQRQGATSYLTEFGLRNASVVLEYAGQTSTWRVPEASVDFDHSRKRSVISGRAKVDSARGPWAFSFLTDESVKTGRLQVKATVRDLVPATLAAAAPPFALLGMFQLPIAGDATVELSTEGAVESSELALEAGSGRIRLPDFKEPFNLTGGLFRLSYDGKERQWQLAPSPVKWQDGSILFAGSMKDSATSSDAMPVWNFELVGQNGVLEAPDFDVPAINLDAWNVAGSVTPRRGLVDIKNFRMAGGGGEATMTGTTKAGPDGQSMKTELKLSAMPLQTLKVFWPRAFATGTRSWVGTKVSKANFKGGVVRFNTGDFATSGIAPNLGKREQLSAAMEISDATFVPLTGMAPITAARGLVQIDNNALEVTIPEAVVTLSADRRVPLKGLRLASQDVLTVRTESEITFTTDSALGPFLETVEKLPVRAVQDAAPFPKAGDGKVAGQFTIKLPLITTLGPNDLTIEGKARISDGRFGKVGGQFDVQGFSLNLDLTPASLDAKGDLLVNGVPAKITAQRLFNTSADLQPPLKITADLDDADRKQLGLDINDIVRGVVPVEISLQKGQKPEPSVKLSADLTKAELVIDQVAWRKAPGRDAKIEADIVPGKTNKTELQNFKISGDDIDVDGWIGIGQDNKLREFHFPTFALNVVSRLDVQGKLGNDDIWTIKAQGPTFDGRDFFRSLFSVGDSPARKEKSSKASGGANVSAEIGTVIGASDVSLRGLKLKLSTQGGNLQALDARGTLDGGAPLAMVLDHSTTRRLLVDSVDAGQVLRLVDFYPNMQGGRLKLEVNLDGSGPADKTGILWVDDFKVLGDPIVSEVVSSADQGRPAISGKSQITREVFQFDKMKAPFSIGYGQFVLEESYMKGPLVGANVRGKVDFKTRRVNIGGTYIPLQGLNGAFGGIPVLGQLISGVRGEGIFGITFAVQGPMSNPEVLVNPLSMVAPGIFRDMFQLTTIDPKVQVREDKAQQKPPAARVRASSSPNDNSNAKKPASKTVRAGKPEVVDGWSSTTKPQPVRPQ